MLFFLVILLAAANLHSDRKKSSSDGSSSHTGNQIGGGSLLTRSSTADVPRATDFSSSSPQTPSRRLLPGLRKFFARSFAPLRSQISSQGSSRSSSQHSSQYHDTSEAINSCRDCTTSLQVKNSESSTDCIWPEEHKLWDENDDTIWARLLDNTWIDCFPPTTFTDSIRKHITALQQFVIGKQFKTKSDTYGGDKKGMEVFGYQNVLFYKQYIKEEDESFGRYQQAQDVYQKITTSVLSILYTNLKGSHVGVHYMLPVVYYNNGCGLLERKIAFSESDKKKRFKDRMEAFKNWSLRTYGVILLNSQGYDHETDVVALCLRDNLRQLMSDCAECKVPEGITIPLTP